MQLDKTIRTYRKNKNMTQEEMANRLGVTASAVNKWENGNSYPDITLLSPIARLLDISLDTLLSFQEELTQEEINAIILEADNLFREKPFEEAFEWAKKKLEQYPNCTQLICNMALMLDGLRIIRALPDTEKYDDYICSLYVRALESEDETMRYRATDALFGFYMRKEDYGKAEDYLKYFPAQDPIRKIKLAQLHKAAGKIEEACKTYEELLFSTYQIINGALQEIYVIALENEDTETARFMAQKLTEAAKCFEMGRYYEIAGWLDIAILEKDSEKANAIMQEMLASVDQIGSFSKSPLYAHMEFQETRPEFLEEFKNTLRKSFQNEETFLSTP